MDAKSDDAVTEPNPSVDDVTELRPATQAKDATPAVADRKAARKEAERQPLNVDDPEPAWLSRGSGRRTAMGILLVLVLVAGVGALGWWLFNPASAAPTDEGGKLTSDDCRVTEHQDEGARVQLPSKLGETQPRSTATVTTNVGEISVLLFGDVSPCGVSAFDYLTRQGFYANSPCYRLTTQATEPKVTLRCGDPTSTGKGGPGFRYQAEDGFTGEVGRDYVALINDRKGMAGGNFAFIQGESKPTASVSVIGQVIAGHEVLDQIGAAAGVDPFDDEPVQPIVIQKITIKSGTVTLPPSGGSSPSDGGTSSSGGTSTPSGSGQPSSTGGSSSSGFGFPD